ncbi:MAG TPA: sigma-70 family RNA polymerase sigma factor [Blastocatellia bacterium]|nr:sigma-70 family RNA polymerase sigma factor [Blastocatellia bacterium]
MDETNPGMSRSLKDITEEEWYVIYQKLRLFTHKRYWYLRGKAGLELDDVVQQAIVDTLQGKRTWPPADENLTIFAFLRGVIRSNISNELTRAGNNVLVWPSEHGSVSEDHQPRTQQAQLPDQQAISKELLEKLHQTIGEDERLVEVLKKLLLGFTPKQIADELGVDITEVRNAQKRLKKRISKLREDLNAPMPEGAVSAR